MFWYEYLYNACFGILQRRIPRILQRVACANLYGPYWYCVLLKYASFGILLITPIFAVKTKIAAAHFRHWWCWCSLCLCFILSWNCCQVSFPAYVEIKLKIGLLALPHPVYGYHLLQVFNWQQLLFSFGAGLIGSLVYLRMLGTSVDSLAGGTGETVKYVPFS